MTKIGIIGAGRWATPYALSAKHAGATVAGIYTPDPSAAKLASRIGSQPVDDPRKLMQLSDLVLIGSPTDTHGDYLVMAAEAGKPVLCASPVAHSPEQFERVSAVTAPGSVCSLPLRSRPEYLRLKKAITSGDLGTLGMIRLGLCRPRHDGWRAESGRSGGMMLESGIHLVDALEWLAGPIERIYGAGSGSGDKQYNLLVARLVDGSIAHLEVSWAEADGVSYDYYEVSGSNGLLDYDSRREPLLVVEYHDDRPGEVLTPGATAAQHELAAVVNQLGGNSSDSVVNLAQGLALCRKVARIQNGIQAGEVVTL